MHEENCGEESGRKNTALAQAPGSSPACAQDSGVGVENTEEDAADHEHGLPSVGG